MAMKRRDALKGMAAMSAAIITGASVTGTSRTYGRVTVDRHQMLCRQGVHLHVMHRGHDITMDCWYADDTGEGTAGVFLRNANGQRYLRPIADGEYGVYKGEREVAKETVYGVTIIDGAPF